MNRRAETFLKLAQPLDVLVIGGGATGLGIALDSQTRGFRTGLVEAADFAQATSSRATKLVHGGVRYLAGGQFHLVYEALRERRRMLQNAPHLVRRLPLLLPVYRALDLPFYGAGLKLYDLISGSSSMGRTRLLGAAAAQRVVPQLRMEGLKGGILYYDGQFDDARFALALARTAEDHGAVVLNHCRCAGLLHQEGRVSGGVVEDMESGETRLVSASVVINATGIFVDQIRRQDDAAAAEMLTVSRGTHIVVDSRCLGGDTAIMVPKTSDGRIIFAIPWMGRTVIGTTDVASEEVVTEPGHDVSEIDFLLETINPYLSRTMTRRDVLSVFSGLRPLVSGSAVKTSKLSREHTIVVSGSGLITVAGGKWTTYRKMAEDTMEAAMKRGMLPERPCVSADIPLHGSPGHAAVAGPLNQYGTDAAQIERLYAEDESLRDLLDPALPFTAAEVVFAVREEMARTVEDVLSRRTRMLLMDARAAARCARVVAGLMARELGRDSLWVDAQVSEFRRLVEKFYLADAPQNDSGKTNNPEQFLERP